MVDVLKYALGPLLLRQGQGVRRRTPRLPEAAGAREGVEGSGEPLRLLVVGDSSGAGVGAEHQEAALLGQLVRQLGARGRRVEYRLLAHTGDTTAQATQRARAVESAPFDLAVTALGVNDVTSACTPDDFVADIAALCALLVERFEVRQTVLSGLPPVGEFPALPQPLRWYLGRLARRCDRALQAFAASRPDCCHVGVAMERDPTLMASDGFHPGPRVYATWAARVTAAVTV